MPVGGFRTPTAVDTDSARRPCLCGRPRHESRSEGRRHILPEPLDGRPAVASDRYTDSGTRSARLRRSVSTNLLPRGCRERRNGEPAEKTEPRTGTAPTASPSRRAAQRGRLNPAVRYGGVGDEHVIRTVRMKDQPDRGGPDPRGARATTRRPSTCCGIRRVCTSDRGSARSSAATSRHLAGPRNEATALAPARQRPRFSERSSSASNRS